MGGTATKGMAAQAWGFKIGAECVQNYQGCVIPPDCVAGKSGEKRCVEFPKPQGDGFARGFIDGMGNRGSSNKYCKVRTAAGVDLEIDRASLVYAGPEFNWPKTPACEGQ